MSRVSLVDCEVVCQDAGRNEIMRGLQRRSCLKQATAVFRDWNAIGRAISEGGSDETADKAGIGIILDGV